MKYGNVLTQMMMFSFKLRVREREEKGTTDSAPKSTLCDLKTSKCVFFSEYTFDLRLALLLITRKYTNMILKHSNSKKELQNYVNVHGL